MEKKYYFLNNLFGWLSFIGASLVYILTAEPTASLWDCGEFIATAHKLQIGHPPGAPVFLMLGRIFSLFASSPEYVAYAINILSALASGATIMFLFWTTTHLARKLFKSSFASFTHIILILFAGIIGAGAYTFTDTFWFSAVEGEVYALSSLLTAIVFWAILKWEDIADQPHNEKWLLLIAYLMGLSIGVHLLNLLTISAIVFVVYFKKYTPTVKGIITAAAISFAIIAFMMWGVITGSVEVAGQFELLFVNVLNLPVHSGLLFYIVLLIASFVASILYTRKADAPLKLTIGIVTVTAILVGLPFLSGNVLIWLIMLGVIILSLWYIAKKNRMALNTIVNVLMVVMIGYSSYAMIIIRSNVNPPMNENAPDHVFSLLSYLNREQYGSTPLIYGPYYNAAPEWLPNNSAKIKEKFTYTLRDGKYVKVSNGIEYKFNSKFNTFFPRMYSREQHHIAEYKNWGGIKEGENTRKVYYDKERKTYEVPTFGQNLKYFFTYQLGHMYVRYFMWNFSGRQNDIQGHGSIINGNWITGISFIDKGLVGDQTNISEKARTDKTRNVYYMLPFALGLIGLFYQISRHKQDALVVALLFFMTGIAIVIFLNQTPFQPRERDYAYAGSFYAYCIWIGLAVIAIYQYAKKYLSHKYVSIALAILLSLPAPIVLAVQNWDDHDRSGRYTARDFAYNYLMSCEPNSMIVSAGDNDTFPLWYLQEVEGIRTDVRVLCSPLLATDWYSQQMMRKTYESEPLPLKLTPKQVAKGIRDVVRVQESIYTQGKVVPLKDAMEVVRDDNMKISQFGDSFNYMPASKLSLPVDKLQAMSNNAVSLKDSSKIVNSIEFSVKDNSIYKNKLIIFDALDGYEWNRPLHFTSSMSAEELGLEDYLRYDGFTYKFVPVRSESKRASYIDTDIMYNNLINVYKWGGMGDTTIHMGHFNERTTRVIGIRAMFNQLSLDLIVQNKKDSAKVVLDKLTDIMPDSQFPYFDANIIYTAYSYYMLGDEDSKLKARAALRIFIENLTQEIEWFNSLQPRYYAVVQKERNEYIRYIVGAADIVKNAKDEEFLEELVVSWQRVGEEHSLKDILQYSGM